MDLSLVSPDARRLLFVLDLYASTPKGPRVWIKEFVVNAIVYKGIRTGVFTEYDLVLGSTHYQGGDYFAMRSQEADTELHGLFEQGVVEKIVLNTQFHTPEIGWRLAVSVKPPTFLSAPDQKAVRSLVICEHCRERCYDYLAIMDRGHGGNEELRRRLYRVCSCYRGKNHHRERLSGVHPLDELVQGFFRIGDCEYTGSPLFMENINEW